MRDTAYGQEIQAYLHKKNKKYARAIVDIYNEKTNENQKAKDLFKEINQHMYTILEKKSLEILEVIQKIVKNGLPETLKPYANGYAVALVWFYTGNRFMEESLKNGFVQLNKDAKDYLLLNYFTDC